MSARSLYSRLTAITLCLIVATTASYASDLTRNVKDLEQKYFHHDYSKQPIEKRVDRLDKLVFGSASSGTLDSRVSHLMSAADAPSGALAVGLPSNYSSHKGSRYAAQAPQSPRAPQAPKSEPVRKPAVASRPQIRPAPKTTIAHQPTSPPIKTTRNPQAAPSYHRQLARNSNKSNSLSYNRGNQSSSSSRYDDRSYSGSPRQYNQYSTPNYNNQYNSPNYNNQSNDTAYDTGAPRGGVRSKISNMAGKLKDFGKRIWDYF